MPLCRKHVSTSRYVWGEVEFCSERVWKQYILIASVIGRVSRPSPYEMTVPQSCQVGLCQSVHGDLLAT